MNNKSIIDVFVEGARKGFKVNINSMLPNLVGLRFDSGFKGNRHT